jgi:predicted dehydrogenase
VKHGEPLQAELGAFVESVVTGSEPVVTGEDGLEAVRIAHMVSEAAGIEADLPEPAVEQ